LRASGWKNSPQWRHLHDPLGCIALHPQLARRAQFRSATDPFVLDQRGEEKPLTEEEIFRFDEGRKSTEEEVISYPPETDEFLLAADIRIAS
jgi:hypothetical protein